MSSSTFDADVISFSWDRFPACGTIILGDHLPWLTILQLNTFNTDTEGAIESVHINGVSPY